MLNGSFAEKTMHNLYVFKYYSHPNNCAFYHLHSTFPFHNLTTHLYNMRFTLMITASKYCTSATALRFVLITISEDKEKI